MSCRSNFIPFTYRVNRNSVQTINELIPVTNSNRLELGFAESSSNMRTAFQTDFALVRFETTRKAEDRTKTAPMLRDCCDHDWSLFTEPVCNRRTLNYYLTRIRIHLPNIKEMAETTRKINSLMTDTFFEFHPKLDIWTGIGQLAGIFGRSGILWFGLPEPFWEHTKLRALPLETIRRFGAVRNITAKKASGMEYRRIPNLRQDIPAVLLNRRSTGRNQMSNSAIYGLNFSKCLIMNLEISFLAVLSISINDTPIS